MCWPCLSAACCCRCCVAIALRRDASLLHVLLPHMVGTVETNIVSNLQAGPVNHYFPYDDYVAYIAYMYDYFDDVDYIDYAVVCYKVFDSYDDDYTCVLLPGFLLNSGQLSTPAKQSFLDHVDSTYCFSFNLALSYDLSLVTMPLGCIAY
ncbi:uncharacterized protein LOC106866381 [Brachypodium distachyon]|uniref:uncharacterized protein LOC106866381 n=1 Tax=Brachypodium distachyon TaxID=15368 RepID=UPI000D0D9ECC|nr:uncharacterized protein LOC106866381 [Brachypodium distachyon]|eukprot:XP_024316280.1 uncharacterized protein LOC106866381 [Brachypodium distachyon]